MSKKKIYYVLCNSVVAGQTNSPAPKLFGSLKEATKAYTDEKKEIKNKVKNWSKTNEWGEEIHQEIHKVEDELKEGKAFFQIYNANDYDGSNDNMQVELGYQFVEISNKLYKVEHEIFDYAKYSHTLKEWTCSGINRIVFNNKDYWDSKMPRKNANIICELDRFDFDEDGYTIAYLKEVK